MVGAPRARIFQQRTGHCFCYPRQHLGFRRERVRCALLQSAALSRNKYALVLLRATFVQPDRRVVGSHRGKCHPDLQCRCVPDDDRCVVGFLLARCDVYILAGRGKEPAFLLVLAAYWIADWAWFSFQIHERTRACLDCVSASPGSTAQKGVCTPGFVLITRCVRPLHRSADNLESATCVGHTGASAFAGKSRPRLWFSSSRGIFVSRSALSGVLAISLPGPGLGCHRKLAKGQSAIQSAVLDVVWVAGVSLLFASVSKQSCRAKLGRTCISGFRSFGNSFLVGKTRTQRYVTDRRCRGDAGWALDEYRRPEHRFVAHGWIQVQAKRSKRPDARMEKRHDRAGKNA